MMIASNAVNTNKDTPRYVVPFCRTLVVCAPASESIMPPPNAAPRPSWRGRCISTTRMRRMQTMISRKVRIQMRMFMGGREYGTGCRLGNWLVP
jgi:hypothetical protein